MDPSPSTAVGIVVSTTTLWEANEEQGTLAEVLGLNLPDPIDWIMDRRLVPDKYELFHDLGKWEERKREQAACDAQAGKRAQWVGELEKKSYLHTGDWFVTVEPVGTNFLGVAPGATYLGDFPQEVTEFMVTVVHGREVVFESVPDPDDGPIIGGIMGRSVAERVLRKKMAEAEADFQRELQLDRAEVASRPTA